MTEADAKGPLELRTDQLRHTEEIEGALAFEIANIESNVIPEHRRRRDQAAGDLISRTPQFLALIRRVNDAFATLRDVRLMVSELRRMAVLDDDLCRMIESNQPSGAGRFGGEWINAVGRLLADGDALLPGDSYKIDRGNTNGDNPPPSADRGGPRRLPRQRAQGAVVASRRPARQAGGRSAQSRSTHRPAEPKPPLDR